MKLSRRIRRSGLTRLWQLGSWFAARRKPRPRPGDVHRHLWRTDTRRMNVRITELLRDRMRPRWLRIVQDAAETTDDRE